MNEAEQKRRDLIYNEQSKLLASAIDRTSTTCITVGVLGPAAAALYGIGSMQLHPAALAFGTFAWLISAAVLHLCARMILRSLR